MINKKPWKPYDVEQAKLLAGLRRQLHETLTLTDKHIAIVIRILNGAADQDGMNHATRKLYRALCNLSPAMSAWIKTYARVVPDKPETPGAAS